MSIGFTELFTNSAELSLALELNTAFETILHEHSRSKREDYKPAITQAVYQVSNSRKTDR